MLNESNDVAALKRAQRQYYRQLRRELRPEQASVWNAAIAERLFAHPAYQAAPILLCYVSIEPEVDTRSILHTAISQGKTVCVPRCESGGVMRFYQIVSLNDLTPGVFGIPTPGTDFPPAPEDLSRALCLVPGWCFDQTGGRLGYGGGYYDRFLQHYHGMTMGLCYNAFVTDALPQEPTDRAVDLVLTEQGIYPERNHHEQYLPFSHRQ